MEWKHEKNKAQQEKEQKNEDDQKFIMEIRACFHFLFVLFISITISITNLGHPLHYIIGGKDCDWWERKMNRVLYLIQLTQWSDRRNEARLIVIK